MEEKTTGKAGVEIETVETVSTENFTKTSESASENNESNSLSKPVKPDNENELEDKGNECQNVANELMSETENPESTNSEKKLDSSEVPEERNVTLMEYRSGDTAAPVDSSDSEDSSSESSEDEKEAEKKEVENQSAENKINKASTEREESPDRDRRVKLNRYGFEDIRTKGELLPEELPPLEELTITVDESVEMFKVGTIKSIVGVLVIIQTCENVPPLNEDTILFIEGHKVLGQVFEVFGPVQNPWYSVRFNDEDNIKSKGLEEGVLVYCAPKEKTFTRYVFVDSLKKIKGSDASWEDNNEPPEKYIEYSDDESERRAKAKRKNKKQNNNAETDEGNQQNVEKRNKRNRKPNDQPQHIQGQQEPYRPRNPFQGPDNNMNRPRYPAGGNYNPRQNFISRGPRWQGQGSAGNAVSPRFGGPPRFQQMNGHGGHMQNGNNIPGQTFQPGRGGVGNMHRPGFSGGGGPGMGPQGPSNSNPQRFQGPPTSASNFQNNRNQLPGQSSHPFRMDVPPPLFNAPSGFNNQGSISGQNFHNTGQGQPPCSQSQFAQNAPSNQFVTNANSQFNQPGSMNSHFQNSNSFQQNAQNQFGNCASHNSTNQFRPNFTPQNQTFQSDRNFQNQFQNVQGPQQNMFQGNVHPAAMPCNQSNTPPVQNNGNVPGNHTQSGPRNQLRIHGLNPGLQSNGGNVPVAPVRNGYDAVQLNSSNIQPYRPELGQGRNGPINFSGVPPPTSLNNAVNTNMSTFQGDNCSAMNTGQGVQSQFVYQNGPQNCNNAPRSGDPRMNPQNFNNIQRPGVPNTAPQNFSNFQRGIVDQRFIENNQN